MYQKIKMTVKNANEDRTWDEFYTTNEPPEEYAQRIISYFNSTLRPGERARELVSVVVIGEDTSKESHSWEKQNLVTVCSRGMMYDVMACTKCGVTGRRYGLSGCVVRDRTFKAKKYDVCKG